MTLVGQAQFDDRAMEFLSCCLKGNSNFLSAQSSNGILVEIFYIYLIKKKIQIIKYLGLIIFSYLKLLFLFLIL